MRDDLESAFDLLVAQGLKSIEWGRADQFRSILDALVEPMEVGLTTLREYGLSFDAATAREVFPFEWRALEKPFDSYHRILEACVRSTDRELLDEITAWPWRVMRLAVSENDHFYFQKATAAFQRFYVLSRRDASPIAKQILRDMCWRRMKEFGSFNLSAQLREADPTETLRLMSFAETLLSGFAEVLKLAIDEGDHAFWDDAGPGFWQLLNIGYITRNRDPEVEIAIQRAEGETDSNELLRASTMLRIVDLRDSLWLQLGAWSSWLWLNKRITTEATKSILMQIAEAFQGDFRRLWQAYNHALSTRREDNFRLSRWETFLHVDGQVYASNAESTLTTLFVALTLAVAPVARFESLRNIRNPAQALWLQGLVDRALATIKDQQRQWASVLGRAGDEQERALSDLNLDQERPLRDLLDAAVGQEKAMEEQQIIDQPLSTAKLDEFRTNFLASWAESAQFRWLLEEAGAWENSERDAPEGVVFGFFTSVPKGYFVEKTGTTFYGGLGENFGSGMARGEDERIYEHIRSHVKQYRLGRRDLASKLDDVIRAMRSRGSTPDLILLRGGWSLANRLDGSTQWNPVYVQSAFQRPGHMGDFGGIPGVGYYRSGPAEVVILDTGRYGKVVQFLARDGSIIRRFEIRGYLRDEAVQLASNPERLPAAARGMAESEAVRYLLQQVIIRIDEALEVRVVDRLAGALISVGTGSEE